jgi:VWFA-related protein
VTVKDNNGRHIKDLTPGNFKLWEDGVEQKILAVDKVDFMKKEKGSTMSAETAGMPPSTAVRDTTQKRYFTLLIGNLPELKVEREKSRSAIINFINNDIQPTDYLSLYVLSPTSLEIVVPYDINPLQSKLSILKYLKTENFGGRGFKSTRRGRLNWSDEDRHIKNMEFLQIAKLLDNLCKSLQYISGKKDVIVFSEGFFFDPDFAKDMVVQADSDSVKDFVKFALKKLSPSTASLGRSLIDLRKIFIKYDISLEVIDLGKSSNLMTAINEETKDHIKNPTEMDTPASFERSRIDALQTISNSSGGKYYPYSDTQDRIVKNLEAVDYDTSFYYVISYSSSEENDPDTYLPIKVEVSRDDVTLGYKKGIVVRENFENLNEKEQNAQLSYIAQSSILYNMISICSNVVVLPAENNNSNLVFGSQMPLEEIMTTDKKGNKVDLDIFITVFNKKNEAISSFNRQAQLDIKKEDRKGKKKELGLYCSMPMDAGEYRVKFFIRNRNNMLISSEEFKVNVPDFTGSELILSSPLIYKDIPDIVTVNLNDEGNEKKNTELKSVFTYLPGIYAISNEVKNNKKLKIGVAIKGLTKNEILTRGNGFIEWQAVKPIPAGFAEEPPVDLLYKVDDIIEKNNGIFLTLFELDISDLPKGDFETIIRTAKDGLTASSSIKLHII